MTRAIIRRARQNLREQTQAERPFETLSASISSFDCIVLAYYAASVYLSAKLLPLVGSLAEQTTTWNYLWPLAWVPIWAADPILEIIAVLCLASSLLALQFRHNLWARFGFFLLFFLTASIPNSVGGINHPYHAWIFVSLIFLFLPNKKTSELNRTGKMALATTIFTAQAAMLLFYSMAGFAKLVQGLSAAAAGDAGSLSFGALSWTLADRALQTGTTPLLIEQILASPLLATAMMWGVIYIQTVSIVVAFRQSLKLIWAYALIGFHVGTWLLMEIVFTEHLLLLSILFVIAHNPKTSFQRKVAALPIFGVLFQKLFEGAEISTPPAETNV